MTQSIDDAGVPRSYGLDKSVPDATISNGEADSATVRTLRCRTVAEGRLRQVNYIRDLPPQPVVEVEAAGLLGEAPNASEALLAALGSCLAVGIHANAVARSISIRGLEVDLAADINTSAGWGSGDLAPKTIGFESIRVSVRIDADASPKVLDGLVKHAVLWSRVANSIHNPVHLDVTSVPTAA